MEAAPPPADTSLAGTGVVVHAEATYIRMDEAWAWALYFAIAALISTVIGGVAPAIIDRSPQRGWWSIILAALP